MYHEELQFLNKLYFNKIYSHSFIIYFMVFDVFIQYLPRHVAVYYTKLKSSKIQWTIEFMWSIGFVQNSLHHKIVQTLFEMKGQFININDKLRAEQAILKNNLLEHK